MPTTLPLAPKWRSSYAIIFSLMVGWPFLSTLVLQKNVTQANQHLMSRLESKAPWNLVASYRRYLEQLAKMKSLLADNHKLSPLENFEVDTNTMPETVVLVIGESANRQRMSLYVHPRATTPQLDAMRDELTVFNDVVTTRPYTIEVLQQVLSFADSKHPEAFFTQPTLINMMKQAGYDITWITNQQTQRNTMLITLSQMTDQQVYLNNNRKQNGRLYDGNVVEAFVNTLAQSTFKKFIVVYLLSTHRQYHYRYSAAFKKFIDNGHVPS
ncbi:MAG: heptose-I-phosphate ethanolaminephosphotransferase [Porticoccus sp.]|jgi:heptose-I-phosphate ethanolaminephosphotransferase